jgi:hypothetical protein
VKQVVFIRIRNCQEVNFCGCHPQSGESISRPIRTLSSSLVRRMAARRLLDNQISRKLPSFSHYANRARKPYLQVHLQNASRQGANKSGLAPHICVPRVEAHVSSGVEYAQLSTRLRRALQAILMDPQRISVSVNVSDLLEWHRLIERPEDGPYNRGFSSPAPCRCNSRNRAGP